MSCRCRPLTLQATGGGAEPKDLDERWSAMVQMVAPQLRELDPVLLAMDRILAP